MEKFKFPLMFPIHGRRSAPLHGTRPGHLKGADEPMGPASSCRVMAPPPSLFRGPATKHSGCRAPQLAGPTAAASSPGGQAAELTGRCRGRTDKPQRTCERLDAACHRNGIRFRQLITSARYINPDHVEQHARGALASLLAAHDRPTAPPAISCALRIRDPAVAREAAGRGPQDWNRRRRPAGAAGLYAAEPDVGGRVGARGFVGEVEPRDESEGEHVDGGARGGWGFGWGVVWVEEGER